MGGEGPSRGSPWTRIAATIGVLASLVGIATGVKALLEDDDSPEEPAAEIRARHVRACVRDHGLTQAVQERDPEPGETEIRKPEALPGEFPPFFEQRTYATCDWPPPPGASPDGYRAITVTTMDGPGEFEAIGSTIADRVESRCTVLELDYQFAFMGDFQPLPAIRGRPGQTRKLRFQLPEAGEARSQTVAWSPVEGEVRSLPFYPAPDELVVLHNNQTVLEDVRCVS